MLRAVRHADGGAFLQRATQFLLRGEAENNIILSVAAANRINAQDAGYFATIEEADRVVACGVRSPPHKALISRAEPDALRVLVEDMKAMYDRLPAVLGPEPAVRQFAELWTSDAGAPREGMRQRLFVTSRVLPLGLRTPGTLRVATTEDEALIVEWIRSFIREVVLDHQADPLEMARRRIAEGSIFVWDDGRPASMAGWAGRTTRGVRVNFVYTPPGRRGHGFATACVADLTQRLLDQGVGFCCLLTDLSNPTSNSIYQRIGYRPVCDMTDFYLDA